MDRAKFCKMLEIAKKYSGKTTSDISFDMRILPGNVRRIERGLFAFRMDRCLKYLEYIGYCIRLTSGDKVCDIRDYADIVSWFKNCGGGKSRPSIASELNIDRSYVRLIENGDNCISIDKFLKFAEVCKYDVTLVPNE